MITKILHAKPQNLATVTYDAKAVREETGLCVGECLYVTSLDSDDFFVVGVDLLSGAVVMRAADDSEEINVAQPDICR